MLLTTLNNVGSTTLFNAVFINPEQLEQVVFFVVYQKHVVIITVAQNYQYITLALGHRSFSRQSMRSYAVGTGNSCAHTFILFYNNHTVHENIELVNNYCFSVFIFR